MLRRRGHRPARADPHRSDIELHLIDSRHARLTPEALAGLDDAVAAVHVHHVPVIPELVLAELPPGTAVFVLTHDHAEDLAIIDAALRCDHLGPIGLIGSSAKWRRFRIKLDAAGFTPDQIDRIRTPIGLPGVTTGKEPAAIAVSVAAGWLASNDQDRRALGSAPKTASP
jgi:xanthine dehydrogenase accessory factor